MALTGAKIATFTLTETNEDRQLKICQDKCKANKLCMSWDLDPKTRLCFLTARIIYGAHKSAPDGHYAGMRDCNPSKGTTEEAKFFQSSKGFVLI